MISSDWYSHLQILTTLVIIKKIIAGFGEKQTEEHMPANIINVRNVAGLEQVICLIFLQKNFEVQPKCNFLQHFIHIAVVLVNTKPEIINVKRFTIKSRGFTKILKAGICVFKSVLSSRCESIGSVTRDHATLKAFPSCWNRYHIFIF